MAGTKISEATLRSHEKFKGTEKVPIVDSDLPKGHTTLGDIKIFVQPNLAGYATEEYVNKMKGIIPSGPTSGRPSNPTVGTQYFDTDIDDVVIWNGTEWVEPAAGGQGTVLLHAGSLVSEDDGTTMYRFTETQEEIDKIIDTAAGADVISAFVAIDEESIAGILLMKVEQEGELQGYYGMTYYGASLLVGAMISKQPESSMLIKRSMTGIKDYLAMSEDYGEVGLLTTVYDGYYMNTSGEKVEDENYCIYDIGYSAWTGLKNDEVLIVNTASDHDDMAVVYAEHPSFEVLSGYNRDSNGLYAYVNDKPGENDVRISMRRDGKAYRFSSAVLGNLAKLLASRQGGATGIATDEKPGLVKGSTNTDIMIGKETGVLYTRDIADMTWNVNPSSLPTNPLENSEVTKQYVASENKKYIMAKLAFSDSVDSWKNTWIEYFGAPAIDLSPCFDWDNPVKENEGKQMGVLNKYPFKAGTEPDFYASSDVFYFMLEVAFRKLERKPVAIKLNDDTFMWVTNVTFRSEPSNPESKTVCIRGIGNAGTFYDDTDYKITTYEIIVARWNAGASAVYERTYNLLYNGVGEKALFDDGLYRDAVTLDRLSKLLGINANVSAVTPEAAQEGKYHRTNGDIGESEFYRITAPIPLSEGATILVKTISTADVCIIKDADGNVVNGRKANNSTPAFYAYTAVKDTTVEVSCGVSGSYIYKFNAAVFEQLAKLIEANKGEGGDSGSLLLEMPYLTGNFSTPDLGGGITDMAKLAEKIKAAKSVTLRNPSGSSVAASYWNVFNDDTAVRLTTIADTLNKENVVRSNVQITYNSQSGNFFVNIVPETATNTLVLKFPTFSGVWNVATLADGIDDMAALLDRLASNPVVLLQSGDNEFRQCLRYVTNSDEQRVYFYCAGNKINGTGEYIYTEFNVTYDTETAQFRAEYASYPDTDGGNVEIVSELPETPDENKVYIIKGS